MNENNKSENQREGVRIHEQNHPDGKRIVQRYEDGVLVAERHFEPLASGKQIQRDFDGNNVLQRETQSYGTLEIAIQSNFLNGNKTGETYVVRKRLASRQSYERARLKYSDMPAPDSSLHDFGGALLRDVAAERKAAAVRRKNHVPDPKSAIENDKFCRERISAGMSADARTWLCSSNHNLGEMNHVESRRFVNRLVQHGAVRIFACEIDDYGEQGQNTGHVVVELPKEAASRFKLFKAIARIAESRGFSGDADDGQNYAYLKLD